MFACLSEHFALIFQVLVEFSKVIEKSTISIIEAPKGQLFVSLFCICNFSIDYSFPFIISMNE